MSTPTDHARVLEEMAEQADRSVPELLPDERAACEAGARALRMRYATILDALQESILLATYQTRGGRRSFLETDEVLALINRQRSALAEP